MLDRLTVPKMSPMTTETLAEKIAEMAKQARCEPLRKDEEDWIVNKEDLARFAALVAEDCAKACMKQQSDLRTRQKYAAAIRARYGIAK